MRKRNFHTHSYIHTYIQTHGILTTWVAPRSMREARLKTSWRAIITWCCCVTVDLAVLIQYQRVTKSHTHTQANGHTHTTTTTVYSVLAMLKHSCLCEINDKNCSLSIVLTAVDKKLQNHKKMILPTIWPSAILDFFGAHFDHPQWVLGGLDDSVAKYGYDRCNSFYNINISIFGTFGWKMPIHTTKIGFFGQFDPLNGLQYQPKPKKAHPCMSPRHLSH